VIPRKGQLVMVVRHEDPQIVGHLGHLIEYDSEKDKVLVQMDHTYEYLVLKSDVEFNL
jgi:RNase P/RNase MRP subunit p29